MHSRENFTLMLCLLVGGWSHYASCTSNLQPNVQAAAGGGPGAGKRKKNNAPAGLFEVNVVSLG